MNQPRQQSYGKYAYPASHSYYPTKSRNQYTSKKKNYAPLLIVILGLAIAAYGFVSMPKVDSELESLVRLKPNVEVAAIVFCNPCSGIDGEDVGLGKIMVIDTATAVKQLSLLPGVKQVKLLGQL